MAATLSTISFDDVTLGASVRFTTIEAKQYLVLAAVTLSVGSTTA